MCSRNVMRGRRKCCMGGRGGEEERHIQDGRQNVARPRLCPSISPPALYRKKKQHTKSQSGGNETLLKARTRGFPSVVRVSPIVYHDGLVAVLGVMSDVKVKALRRPRQPNTVEGETATSSRRSKTDEYQPPSFLLDLDLPRRPGRRNRSIGRNSTAAAARKRPRSTVAVAVAAVANAFVLAALLCVSCLTRPVAGLVVEEPFYASFDHV